MKPMIRSIVTLVIILTANSFAQSSEEFVKNNLTTLFELSKSKSYDKASLLISYEGEDKIRHQKDAFNPTNKDELNQVKRICKKISALIDLSSKYELGKFESKEVDGVLQNIIEVGFISGDQKLSTSFSFINTNKGFLLLSMN